MKVITLNKDAFIDNCKLLIHKLDEKPDLIIGVLNGGGYVVNVIKKEAGFEKIQYKNVKLQRIGASKKQNHFFKWVLKLLPYSILNKLRIFESNKAKKSIKTFNLSELSNTEIDFNIASNFKEKIKSILIIDDALDTGRTMFIIKNNLNKIFKDVEIKTAVISWTIENSVLVPDFYLFKNTLVRFPWSKDYKGKGFE